MGWDLKIIAILLLLSGGILMLWCTGYYRIFLKIMCILIKRWKKNASIAVKEKDAAMEAERAGNKYKQVEFMMDKLGEDMEGVISGVSSFGFWVETVNEKCEGLVNVKDLSEYDDFRHDETDYSLVGSRTGKKFEWEIK